MRKAVLIVGIASFFVFLGVTLFLPPCALCIAMLAGAVAGWLAVLWGQPIDENQASGIGAKAGALAGIGALVGQLVGGVLNALLVSPQDAIEILKSLGIPSSDLVMASNAAYYLGAIGGEVCCGLLNIGLFAGLGALAGFLYFRSSGRNRGIQAV
jgi:hypothetical protein